jgi:cytosine/adenosine deaminase-related metal-dependent hydrolase
MLRPVTTRILSAAAIDATGLCVAPAQALVGPAHPSERLGTASLRLLSLDVAGSPAAEDALREHPPTHTIEAMDSVLTPGFVNAHTHLDLTDIPAVEFDPQAGFMGFVSYVLANRLVDGAAIARAVERGVALSRAGGVVAVGDIAGVVRGQASSLPFASLARTGMLGVSYVEFFGFGPALVASLDALAAALRECEQLMGSDCALRPGISPHAPYTASSDAYAHAIRLARSKSLPLCTHLAENPEERAFLLHASGPFRSLHEKLQWWSASTERELATAASPVMHLAPHLRDHAFMLAHVNDASDADIALLASCNVGVVYSPRSSHYFRNHEHFGPHRYEAMLAAGVPIALGTDSVINLPSSVVDGTSGRLSTLDEARLLFSRDDADPLMLLRMLTIYGACLLGLPTRAFRVAREAGEPDTKAGLVLTSLAEMPAPSPISRHSASDWARAMMAPASARTIRLVSPPSR